MTDIPANAVHRHEPPARLGIREAFKGSLELSASEP
jgi:hypothetical protein